MTYTGRNVVPSTSEAPALQDIAVGLGRIPRFAGQTEVFYPVLLHSYVVSALMPTPEWRIFGLLHDAAEAICSDIPRPWKHKYMGDNENEVMERICKEHSLPWPWPKEVWDEILDADHQALDAETLILGFRGHRTDFNQPTDAAIALTNDVLDTYTYSTIQPDIAIKAFTSWFTMAYGIWKESLSVELEG